MNGWSLLELRQRDLDVRARSPIATHGHLHLRARRGPRRRAAAGRRTCATGIAVDLRDDVARRRSPASAAGPSRRDAVDRTPIAAVGVAAERDAEEAVLDFLAAAEHVDDPAEVGVDRDRVARGRVRRRHDGRRGRQPDQLAVEVEQRRPSLPPAFSRDVGLESVPYW